ncbi:protein Loquacious [Parasteatoda tepidariorum]|uniref:protein Loquacious n=1 Tax=Parasteatoda tepidariorum TaxID=114398 RepID=UPI001C720E45|nr:RISC-loading complex subunit tarbp2 [Parasteatoda tepidariorum]XP_042899985.1 RISC-loading complex subunit tarbp2 [Parasteatoda tepidariorum]
MTAAAQRTPVSLLFSMSIQHGWTAEYELTSVEGASHDPTFTYEVKVHDVTAQASGQSKRKAKHSAAKLALEQLLSRPDIAEKGFLFESTSVTAENLDEIIMEPVSEAAPVGGDTKNSIGMLQEYCTKHNKMPPYYETINESGPPHDKIFLVQCMVEQFTTEGEAKTKRLGKRIAAELMLEQLKIYEDISNEESKDNKTPKDECENITMDECEDSTVSQLCKETSSCTLSDSGTKSTSEENNLVNTDMIVENQQ